MKKLDQHFRMNSGRRGSTPRRGHHFQQDRMKIKFSQFAIDQIVLADTPQPSIKLKNGMNLISSDDAEKIIACLEDSLPHIMDGRARRALDNKIYELQS